MEGNVGVSGLACMVIGNGNGKNDAAGHDIKVAGTREGLIENEIRKICASEVLRAKQEKRRHGLELVASLKFCTSPITKVQLTH